MGSRNPGMKRAIIAVVLLAVVGGGVGAWYSQQNKTEIQVQHAPLSRGDIVDSVGATGTLQAVTTVQVGSQVSGNIQWLGADFNSIVKKGQVIARLDPSLFDAQLQQTDANLSQARANLAKARSDLDQRKVGLVDAQRQPVRESTAWNHDWQPTMVTVGADVDESPETRQRVRDFARARLAAPASDAFLAEILAAESDY